MTDRIELFRPAIGEREIAAVTTVLHSGWLGYGPRCEGVERAWSFAVGAKYGVATNSCTSALQIALRLRGVGTGDEVIVPTTTFAATAEAVIAVGAKPVFCDVHAETLLIDLDSAEKVRTDRTKAIIPVLYAGQPFEIGNTWYGLPVIYDCAHAAGASFSGYGKLCCWSFQAVKNLGCGDGGMLTMMTEAEQVRAKTLAWHGISRSTWDRSAGAHYTWEYDVKEVGYKAQMTDITAAILSVQIERMGDLQQVRRQLAYEYLKQLDEFEIVGRDSAHLNGWHLLVIKSDHRNQLGDYLSSKGIVTGVHYRPLHLHTAFAGQAPLPVAEREWQRILSLPLHPGLTTQQVGWIADSIRQFTRSRKDSI